MHRVRTSWGARASAIIAMAALASLSLGGCAALHAPVVNSSVPANSHSVATAGATGSPPVSSESSSPTPTESSTTPGSPSTTQAGISVRDARCAIYRAKGLPRAGIDFAMNVGKIAKRYLHSFNGGLFKNQVYHQVNLMVDGEVLLNPYGGNKPFGAVPNGADYIGSGETSENYYGGMAAAKAKAGLPCVIRIGSDQPGQGDILWAGRLTPCEPGRDPSCA